MHPEPVHRSITRRSLRPWASGHDHVDEFLRLRAWDKHVGGHVECQPVEACFAEDILDRLVVEQPPCDLIDFSGYERAYLLIGADHHFRAVPAFEFLKYDAHHPSGFSVGILG